jgi:gluconate 2-dehydrogenase gamma chain
MTDDSHSKKISRRELLRGAGMAGAASLFPGVLPGLAEVEGEVLPGDPAPPSSPSVPAPSVRTLPQNLTVEETEILDAMIGRLIPTDEYGPGAREAGALEYIDRELGGALSSSRDAYRTGLFALDRYAQHSRGARFVELSSTDQDSVLFDLQTGGATGSGAGFSGSSGTFFNLVKGHTWQATFGDPIYGGNRDFIGWDLIAYPGPRRAVSEEDQRRLESGTLDPVRRSAYE